MRRGGFQSMAETLTRFAGPPVGVYACANDCGRTTRLPGVCEGCVEDEVRARYQRELLPALRSIPPRFQWAIPGDDEAAERLRHQRIQDWPRVRRELMEAIEAGRNVVLLGPKPQVGKTSAACVMLRRVIELGALDALPEDARMAALGSGPAARPGERPRFASDRLAEQVRIARGARFVAVRDVRGESPEAIEARREAKRATVLVFDDVGDELDGAPAASGWIPERIAGTREVVDYRHKRPELRTIFTTWLPKRDMAKFYGGGTAERVYEHAALVKVGPQEGA